MPPVACVLCVLLALFAGLFFLPSAATGEDRPPNILWIVVEDASAHIGCYGETAIATPHLDRLAEEGVRFTDAIVTCPVCSPSRSAMITGMYQTTLGAHNHRSQREEGRGGGSEDYFESFRLPLPTLPELFRAAGYHVTNSGLNGKEDYNFLTDGPLYDEGDWSDRGDPAQPFFAQIQLAGGKNRRPQVPDPVDPAAVGLPPYYADDPVIRADWARYLDSWVRVDEEVAGIVEALREAGELERTVVFFWTDHGLSHLRGKQFLYEEGIHVPLIVRFGDGRHAGTVREDLVEHIDIAAASLAAAGLPVPEHLQGRDFFSPDHRRREVVFAARDRCDETVEIQRAARTKQWKYIRNFKSYLPHAQPNFYKDRKPIVETMRRLHAEGALDELQSRPFVAPRPVEELYDLLADPYETKNLAADPAHRELLEEMRGTLYSWMEETGDPGLIPEPILEDLGREHGSKMAAMQAPGVRGLLPRLIETIEAGERGDAAALRPQLAADDPSVRYWSATWLGVLGDSESLPALRGLREDGSAAVRIAAALALCRLGERETGAPLLADHIEDPNLLAGMYAIRALEQLGPEAKPQLPAIEAALENPYEFTRRYARRMTENLESGQR